MNIDYSAPKAHTSLFSQVMVDDDEGTSYTPTKQGSQTINLAELHAMTEAS